MGNGPADCNWWFPTISTIRSFKICRLLCFKLRQDKRGYHISKEIGRYWKWQSVWTFCQQGNSFGENLQRNILCSHADGSKLLLLQKALLNKLFFTESILWHIVGRDSFQSADLSGKIEQALTLPIDSAIIQEAVKAPTIFFCRGTINDGVAEELTLKNEWNHP